jgi:hypothetical protein
MALEGEDHIRVRAYHLWEANGRPEGRDLEFWEKARQITPDGGPTVGKRRAPQSLTAGSGAAKGTKRNRRPARKRSE